MVFFVTALLQLILLAIVAAITTADMAWVRAGHFDVDAKAYGLLALLSIAMAAGGIFYEYVRKDARLAAMLIGTSFLLGMSASFSVLNYLLITVAGHRIDLALAAIDRALGVDWPAMMALAADHPLVNMVLQLFYISVLPQIALLVVALGFKGKPEHIYALCLSVAAGAAIAIGVWTLTPSFGAFSVYELPVTVSNHLALALDGHYARQLVGLLGHGPGHIAPSAAQGLIGFPSYHAVLALLVVWYARELPVIRWVTLGINSVVLAATPIQGGHHVVDVLGGFAAAAVAVLFADSVVRFASRAKRRIAMKAQTATF